MSSPRGHGEQLTALLSSLQKSFTYLRLVIMSPQRLFCSTLNNCLSFALSSWPCYFQVEWHMRGWFCLLRSLSTLFKFFCSSVFCWSPLGSLHLVWAVFEVCCLELSPVLQPRPFLTEKSSGVISPYLVRDTPLCIPLHNHGIFFFFGTGLLVHACIVVYHFPASCAFPVWNFI